MIELYAPRLRFALPEDAAAMAWLKDTIWPKEATPPDYIAKVLQQPDHCTILAIYQEQVVGFVDGFLTLSASGQRRWEVDLLGVDPAYQGRGIGTQLVQAITQAGRDMEGEVTRALVATSNVSSQRVFAKAGYGVGKRPFNLWVSSPTNHPLPIAHYPLPITSHLLPVITLNYQGAWLEGQLSATALRAAQAICARMGWSVAGVLIDVEQNALNETAQAVGYVFINQFQGWWQNLLSAKANAG